MYLKLTNKSIVITYLFELTLRIVYLEFIVPINNQKIMHFALKSEP